MYKTLSEFYYNHNMLDVHTPLGTDKGSIHSYINGYYNLEFSPKRTEDISIMEIGLWRGGSMFLWSNFFTRAKIYGVDILEIDSSSLDPNRVKLFNFDAYSIENVQLFEDNFFDYIIDDGPHTIQSQMDCVNLWLTKLKPGGKMIIEDIQSLDDVINLRDFALKFSDVYSATIIDLRLNKDRYDDFIVEIVKKY